MLTDGKIGVILKISDGNYLIALENEQLTWVSPDKVKEIVHVKDN